jgi:tRNA nucleotidyltransferase (CCA-adding enzyme)
MSVAAVAAPLSGNKRRRKTIMAGNHNVIATKDLVLTEQELKVLNTLKQVVSNSHLSTVVRVAGGWVRDKLLGRDNHDLDITLDDMTGAQFAKMVHQHLTATGQDTSTVAVIQANPERSKHLETATTKVHGKELDFVNLRSEEYTSESRIPTMVSDSFCGF